MFENISISSAFSRTVSELIEKNRLAHAVILEGTDRNTRFLAAQEIAKALLCTGADKPCGNCSSCRKVENGHHPDLHILQKENGSSMIKVDAIRELKAAACVLPNDADKCVFLIREAQDMNIQAQNALLKILEEPAAHVSFILTVNSKSSLLETITSRATAYFLGEERPDDITDEKQASAEEKAVHLLETYVSAGEFELLRETAVFLKDKELFLLTLQAMIPVIRDALVLYSTKSCAAGAYAETAEKLRNALTQKQTFFLLEKTQKLVEDLQNSANYNLTLTRFPAVFYSIKQPSQKG